MSGLEGQSLLNFLDAPVIVGDPEGRVIFANPAFKFRFCPNGEEPQGENLANLFAGGGREAMLASVAEVCSKGQSVKFRLREDGNGYLGVASPIEADDNRVGVVILLTDEPLMDGRLLDFHREIQEPLEETLSTMDELVEQTGGRRDDRYRTLIEQGSASLERARKWSEELHALLCGATPAGAANARLDPVRVARQAAARVAPEFDRAEVALELLMANQLPDAHGDATLLETILVRLLRHRLSVAKVGGSVTILAREAGEGSARALLVSVADRPAPGESFSSEQLAESEPRLVSDTAAVIGARIKTVVQPSAGRITSIRLGLG